MNRPEPGSAAGERLTSPLDLLNLAMLAALLVITLFTLGEAPSNWSLLVAFAAMAGLLLLYPRTSFRRVDAPRRFRQGYPLAYTAVIFDSLGRVIPHVNHWRADDFLMRVDRLLLGVDPTFYLQRFVWGAAVEVLFYAYLLYFFLPFLLLFGLWRAGKIEPIFNWASILIIALYSNYLLYMVVPAMGPYLHVDHPVPLDGVLFYRPLRAGLRWLESNSFDVFPSAHVNAALVTLYGFARFHRRHVGAAAVAVAAIALSTVYLRYHYVIDVVAGAALAGASIWAGERYYRWWASRVRGTRPQEGG